MKIRQNHRNTFVINGMYIKTPVYKNGDTKLPLQRAVTFYFLRNNPALTLKQIQRRVDYWANKHRAMLWRAHWHQRQKKRIIGFPRKFVIAFKRRDTRIYLPPKH